MSRTFTFGVQAVPESKRPWLEIARRCEDLGFTFLGVGDHPGAWPSPFTALAAAAAVTDTVTLGPYVANAGLRDPIDLATDVATLDIVSDGRAVLGLGAGHTPQEWEMRGRVRPSAGDRAQRLIEVSDTTLALLAGETTSLSGTVNLAEANLGARLVRPEIPLLIGGNNRRLLHYAAERAQVVGLTGLGRTLDGGHLHEARWSDDHLSSTFELVRNDRAMAGKLTLQALVQWAEITDQPGLIAEQISRDLQVDVDHVRSAPFVLIGSAQQIAERVAENGERWGIHSYVVREKSMDDIAEVIQLLN